MPDTATLRSPWNAATIADELDGVAAARGNSTLAAVIAGKVDTDDIDSEPTEDSSDPVSSGGVYTALAAKQDKTALTFENGANMDDFTESGVFKSIDSAKTATLINCPVSGVGFTMVVYKLSSTASTQVIYCAGTSSGKIYIRQKRSVGWNPWYVFESTTVAPPVNVPISWEYWQTTDAEPKSSAEVVINPSKSCLLLICVMHSRTSYSVSETGTTKLCDSQQTLYKDLIISVYTKSIDAGTRTITVSNNGFDYLGVICIALYGASTATVVDNVLFQAQTQQPTAPTGANRVYLASSDYVQSGYAITATGNLSAANQNRFSAFFDSEPAERFTPTFTAYYSSDIGQYNGAVNFLSLDIT